MRENQCGGMVVEPTSDVEKNYFAKIASGWSFFALYPSNFP